MTKTKWTQFTGSREFGVAEETLARALRKSGLKTGKGKNFTTLEIHNALAGDVRGERTRLLRAKADEQELKNKVRDGELVNLSVAERIIWNEFLFPLEQEFDQMPSKLAPFVNPENPKAAQKLIFEEVEKIKNKLITQWRKKNK